MLVYGKLPGWFTIPTPLGSYNPDWAILMEDDFEEEKLYFVIETKGSVDDLSLREGEKYKIECGEKHFEALGKDIDFRVASDYNEFIENIDYSYEDDDW